MTTIKIRKPDGTYEVVGAAGPPGPAGPAGPLDILTDVTAPANTPAGKVLGTTAVGAWGPIDAPSGLPPVEGFGGEWVWAGDGPMSSTKVGTDSVGSPTKLRLHQMDSNYQNADLSLFDSAGITVTVTQGTKVATFTASGPGSIASFVATVPGRWEGDLSALIMGQTVWVEVGPSDGSVLTLAGGEPAWMPSPSGLPSVVVDDSWKGTLSYQGSSRGGVTNADWGFNEALGELYFGGGTPLVEGTGIQFTLVSDPTQYLMFEITGPNTGINGGPRICTATYVGGTLTPDMAPLGVNYWTRSVVLPGKILGVTDEFQWGAVSPPDPIDSALVARVEALEDRPASSGPTGPTGATGPQGLKGDPGSTGPAGADGAAGPAGPNAASGKPGNSIVLAPDGLLWAPNEVNIRADTPADEGVKLWLDLDEPDPVAANPIWKGTQAEFDALATKNPDILYVVIG